jgi:hypothetical protein
MIRIILTAFVISTFFGCAQSDKKVNLEKIIFHTSMCFGTCPTYHLQVDNNKNVKLYAEQVYKNPRDISSYENDTEKMGYFVGKISDTTFNKLTNELSEIGLDTLKFDDVNCCDGSLITIIVYYNGKRKFLKSMFPPEKSNTLISTLYDICKPSNLTKTTGKFIIENENASR